MTRADGHQDDYYADPSLVIRPAGDGTNDPAYEALLEIARCVVLRVDKWGAPFAVATEVDKLRPFVARAALTSPEADQQCPTHGDQRSSKCPTCVDLVERPGGERDRNPIGGRAALTSPEART